MSGVALICGGGAFPIAAAKAAQARGEQVFLLGLRGIAGPEIEQFSHVWLGVGQLGRAFEEILARDITEICFIGGLKRPEFSDLRLDWGGIKRIPDIVKFLQGGDDHALKGVIKLLESVGLTVIGVDALAPELLAARGDMAGALPVELAGDLAFAQNFLRDLSAYDCGQGAVFANRRVIAVEAVEGTDAMLARVAELRAKGRWRPKGRAGFLIKAPKRGQDLRVDLPAIGPQTLSGAESAGLRGVAVAAGGVLMLDRAALKSQAERAGLFLHGFGEGP